MAERIASPNPPVRPIMTEGNKEKIGILPSLEVLPFFYAAFMEGVDVGYAAHASYGRIAREMLAGNLAGGVLQWEIFVSEVFSLPGQRNQWTVAFFSKPGPTELVFQAQIHKSIRPDSERGGSKKFPAKLQIGIESRNSLTRRHFMEWLGKVNPIPRPEIVFRFLPMDQRLLSIHTDALDGFIARSPWGRVAEERNLGTLAEGFPEAAVALPLVTVCRKDSGLCRRLCAATTPARLSAARGRLSERAHLESAAGRMDASGKPRIPFVFLAKAAMTHGISDWDDYMPADIAHISAELQSLGSLGHLPARVAANAQTARLLAFP